MPIDPEKIKDGAPLKRSAVRENMAGLADQADQMGTIGGVPGKQKLDELMATTVALEAEIKALKDEIEKLSIVRPDYAFETDQVTYAGLTQSIIPWSEVFALPAATLEIDLAEAGDGQIWNLGAGPSPRLNGMIQVWIANGQINAAGVDADGKWNNIWAGSRSVKQGTHKVVLRWGDGRLTVKVDSILDADDAAPSAPFTGPPVSGRPIVTGALPTDAANPPTAFSGRFTGKIRWKLHKARLNDDQVARLFGEDPAKFTPLALGETLTLTKNAALITVDVLANDKPRAIGATKVELISIQAPAKGIANIVAGKVTYKPNANTIGADSVRYLIRDDLGNEATGVIAITIADVGSEAYDTPPNRTDFVVSNEAEWRAAEAAVKPGQVIKIKAGNYNGKYMRLGCVTPGTAAAPIWVVAESGVVFGTGNCIACWASHRRFHGFEWTTSYNFGPQKTAYAVPGSASATRRGEAFPGSYLAVFSAINVHAQKMRFVECRSGDSMSAIGYFIQLVGVHGKSRDIFFRGMTFVKCLNPVVGHKLEATGVDNNPRNVVCEDFHVISSHAGKGRGPYSDIGFGTGQGEQSLLNPATPDFYRGNPIICRRFIIEDSNCIETTASKQSDMIFEDCIQIAKRNGSRSENPNESAFAQRTGGYGMYRRIYIWNTGYGFLSCGPGNRFEDNIVVDANRAGCFVAAGGRVQPNPTKGRGNAWAAWTGGHLKRSTILARGSIPNVSTGAAFVCEGYPTPSGFQSVTSHKQTTVWAKDDAPARNALEDNVFVTTHSYWGQGALSGNGNSWARNIGWNPNNASMGMPPGTTRKNPGMTIRTARIKARDPRDGYFDMPVPFFSAADGAGADPYVTLRAWIANGQLEWRS